MAGYDKFDPRLESLVVEVTTDWDKSLENLPEEKKRQFAQAIHRLPALASTLSYERTHTGFIRKIVVTEADLGRIQKGS
ncbi:hypothetical protein [Planctomicrobium sp. SH527]|uniref:hypothetical protein n=1 Tax=Planctomicrobium sp. SH527 TaxID=3448123 RepID=UPI003F5CAF4C